MKISCVSLTGADDAVNPRDLHDLQVAFPFIEWAILVSPPHTGQPRYPQRAWIERFLAEVPGPKALHICSNLIHDFVQGEADIHALAQRFNRVQLNIFQKRDPVDPASLDRAIRAFGHPVIMAFNPGNALLNDALTAPNIEGLFDRSGGRGVAPDSWPPILPDRRCGYAGGLKPENIAAQLQLIFEAAAERTVWVDMETGLRNTADQFDLARVRAVCEICRPYC